MTYRSKARWGRCRMTSTRRPNVVHHIPTPTHTRNTLTTRHRTMTQPWGHEAGCTPRRTPLSKLIERDMPTYQLAHVHPLVLPPLARDGIAGIPPVLIRCWHGAYMHQQQHTCP